MGLLILVYSVPWRALVDILKYSFFTIILRNTSEGGGAFRFKVKKSNYYQRAILVKPSLDLNWK